MVDEEYTYDVQRNKPITKENRNRLRKDKGKKR